MTTISSNTYEIKPENPILEPFVSIGSISTKNIFCSKFQKPLLVALVILGIGSLGIVIGVGTTGLVSTHSIAFITLTALSGTAFLLAGINLILLKRQKKDNNSDPIIPEVENGNPPDPSILETKKRVSLDKFEESVFEVQRNADFISSFKELNFPFYLLRDQIMEGSIASTNPDYKFEASSETIHVQKIFEKNKEILKISIPYHQKPEFYFNKQLTPVGRIPSELLELFPLEKVFRDFVYKTSRYSIRAGKLEIKVNLEGVKRFPEFHLKKLTENINNIILGVKFIDEQGLSKVGTDAGGLSRQYLTKLIESLINSQTLAFEKLDVGFLMPRTKQNYISKEVNFPTLTKEEEEIYQQMGMVFLFCYHSLADRTYNYLTGHYFNPALFNAILCLTFEEIETSFKDLPQQTYFKMLSALTAAHGITYFDKAIQLLAEETLTDDLAIKSAEILLGILALPEQYQENDALNKEKVIENKQEIMQLLRDYVFSNKTSMGNLVTQLAPIHAIAQGMKSFFKKLNLYSETDPLTQFSTLFSFSSDPKKIYLEFNQKIQGSIDRKKIVDSFDLCLDLEKEEIVNEIMKKLGWLKDWIIEKATDEELEKLLLYITGGKGLPENTKIDVRRQYFDYGDKTYKAVPTVSTCSICIYFSPITTGDEYYNDSTKEKFIESLLALALTDPGAFQVS